MLPPALLMLSPAMSTTLSPAASSAPLTSMLWPLPPDEMISRISPLPPAVTPALTFRSSAVLSTVIVPSTVVIPEPEIVMSSAAPESVNE